MTRQALVSVVLTTRDRPRLLPVALACFEHQTYPNRELIVVDDGVTDPVDEATLPRGARLVRVETGTPLGIKLNHGAAAANGTLCMKMDDDDYYAPEYLETSVSAWLRNQRHVCRPILILHAGFLFFELATWRLHQSIENNVPGATLIFARDAWRRRPFRPVPTDEDAWFYRDQIRAGAVVLPIDSLETFIAIRHRGHAGTFGHTWQFQLDGSSLEDYLQSRPLYSKPPEALLPSWALEIYRGIYTDLNRGDSETPPALVRESA